MSADTTGQHVRGKYVIALFRYAHSFTHAPRHRFIVGDQGFDHLLRVAQRRFALDAAALCEVAIGGGRYMTQSANSLGNFIHSLIKVFILVLGQFVQAKKGRSDDVPMHAQRFQIQREAVRQGIGQHIGQLLGTRIVDAGVDRLYSRFGSQFGGRHVEAPSIMLLRSTPRHALGSVQSGSGTNRLHAGFQCSRICGARTERMMRMAERNTGKALMLGAVGMMALGGCATVEESVAEAVAETHRAELTGSRIVGGRGDSDGYARAELTVSDEVNQVCYDVNEIRNIGDITEIAIHRGRMGSNGPVVMRLKRANEGGWKNCVGRSEWTEDRLERDPAAYYIAIHTSEFPNGAIRGQFTR